MSRRILTSDLVEIRPVRHIQFATGVLLVAATTLHATPVEAQDTVQNSTSLIATGQPTLPKAPSATAADSSAESNGHVEDIIVTAQRREENLQRVPVSITALSATTIARANITTTSGLQQVTPGLTWTSHNRTALPYIRGIGSPDVSIGSESSIALYVDGVYIESSPAAMLALNNIERIEVLKGPQGTLFGRNATGGLIQIITKQPASHPAGNFEVGYGNYDTLTLNGYVTGPLTKSLSADLAVIYTKSGEGWGRNIFLNRKINLDRTFGARSKIRLDIGDTIFTLGGDVTLQRTDIGDEGNIFPGSTGRPINGVPTQPAPGYYDSQSDIIPTGTTKTGGVNLHIEHTFEFAKLTSITSYRRTDFTSLFDVDETSAPMLALEYNTHVKAVTQEVQLASQGSGPLSWIVGSFYMHRNGSQDPFRVSGSQLGFPPFFGAQVVNDDIISNVIAPFGQTSLKIGSGTEITAGIRYTVERQHFTGAATGATGIPLFSVDQSAEYKQPTWRLAIKQDFSKTLMVYLSYNRGFKSGVYNVASITDPPARPEIVDAYEIGFKSDLLDRRLRLNGAIFQYNYKDIQLSVATGASAKTINAAQARIRGGELSIEAIPVDRLTLSLGLSYLPTAKYLSFNNAPAFPLVPTGGNVQTSFDDSGGRMIRAPKLTVAAGGSYLVRVGNGDLDIGINYYRSGSFLWIPDGHKQPAYEVVNSNVTYKFDSGLRAGIWMRNMFGEKYASGFSATATGAQYFPAPPRTFGVKVGYAF